jgi:ABC-type spermidine/putrescine transport system permease subunit II
VEDARLPDEGLKASSSVSTPEPHVHRELFRRKSASDRPRLLWIVSVFTLVFLFFPIVVVVVFSLNSTRSLTAVTGFSLRWYSTVFHDSDLLATVKMSLEIALIVAVVATLLGTLLAFGLVRATHWTTRPSNAMLLMTIVTPETATAVALFLLFITIHAPLGPVSVTLAHVSFSLVFVVLVVRARLATLSRETEEAALDLGATELGSLRLVVFPQLWPAVLASFLLIFVFSFDDFVTSFFTLGVGVPTLPVFIFGMIKFGLTPEIAAVGTLMMFVTIIAGLALLGAFLVHRRRTM